MSKITNVIILSHRAWLFTMLWTYLVMLCSLYSKGRGREEWLTHLTALEKTGRKVEPTETIQRITSVFYLTKMAHYLGERCSGYNSSRHRFHGAPCEWCLPGARQWGSLGLAPQAWFGTVTVFFLIVSCLAVHCPCLHTTLKPWMKAGAKVHI